MLHSVPAPDSSPPASLRERARRALRSFVHGGAARGRSSSPRSSSTGHANKDDGADYQGYAEDEDVMNVLRVLQHEASLMYHTGRVRDALRRDPFELFVADDDDSVSSDDGSEGGPTRKKRKKDNGQASTSSSSSAHIDRPGRRARRTRQRRDILEPVFRTADVLDFDQVVTRDGYARIEATVRLWNPKSCFSSDPLSNEQLSQRHKKKDKKKKRGSDATNAMDAEKRFVELRFCYERTANAADNGPTSLTSVPTYVSYQIEYCGCSGTGSERNADNGDGVATAIVGPRKRLLWVNVVAPWGVPSPHGSQMIVGDDDGTEYDDDTAGTSDVDSSDGTSGGGKGDARGGSDPPPDRNKRPKRSPSGSGDDNSKGRGDPSRIPHVRDGELAGAHGDGDGDYDDDTSDPEPVMKDQFAAGVDTDVLEEFLSQAGWLDSSDDDSEPVMDDGAALYALLSFPFYEPEWDVVGFVLEAAFGPADDDDESIDDEE